MASRKAGLPDVAAVDDDNQRRNLSCPCNHGFQRVTQIAVRCAAKYVVAAGRDQHGVVARIDVGELPQHTGNAGAEFGAVFYERLRKVAGQSARKQVSMLTAPSPTPVLSPTMSRRWEGCSSWRAYLCARLGRRSPA